VPLRGGSAQLITGATRVGAPATSTPWQAGGVPVDPPLAVQPCRDLCSWRPATHARTCEVRDGLPLFRCRGCGSEWVRTEGWTPADADGRVPAPVLAEVRRRTPRSAGRRPARPGL
jgi:hypothetical protein